jgi:hypothetical protein
LVCACNYQNEKLPIPTWDNVDTIIGKIKVQDCDVFDNSSYGPIAAVMEVLETKLKCGSWCKSDLPSVHYFSNINGMI